MTFRTVIDDLAAQSDALRAVVETKKKTLDAATAVAVASAGVVVAKTPGAEANAATAAAKATEATNNANQVAAYKTAAAALDVTTTATAAVTNLLPDMLAKKDPARHPFRKKMPTLVLDFERQKCHRYSPSTGFGETALIPFMTFARNSSATYTGPDGLIKTAAANEARFDYDPLTGECKGLLIEEQRTNLLTYSASMGSSAFGKGALGLGVTPTVRPNYAVAPDGTLTAARVALVAGGVTAGDRSFLHVNIPTDNVQRTLAVYLKSATSQTYTVSSRCNSTSISSVVTPFVWTRVFVSGASAVDNTGYVCSVYGGGAVATSASADLLVWGAQLEAGAFPTSYIPTPAVFSARASTATYLDANGVVQTAASGVARSNAYDYDSDGVLRPIGLLLEASATNQLLYSEQFDNAAWIKYTGSITANAATAPDGTATADLFTSSGTVQSRIEYVAALPTSDTVYTFSFYAKKGSNNYVSADHYSGSKDNYVIFDIANGAIVNQSAGVTSRITKVGSSWYRCSMTITVSASLTHNLFKIVQTDGVTYSTSETGGYFYAWGAQLEVGNYPTSYIPTTTAQVTRAADTSTSAQATRVADDAKVDGTKFSDFYNQTQGTLVGTFTPQGLGGSETTGVFDVSANAATGSDRFGVIISDRLGDIGYAHIRSNNVYVVNQASASKLLSGVKQRCAMSVSPAGESSVFNAEKVATSTSRAPSTMVLLKVGKFDTYLNGHVSRISYYPQPFTNEELQAATSA